MTDNDRLYKHILGSLAAASLGDAMGAATEQWTTAEIVAKHGGLLRSLIKPPPDTFSWGNVVGEITDDTSQMFAMAKLIAERGQLDREEWTQVLVDWSQHSPQRRMMGPSSKPILEAIAKGEDPSLIGTVGASRRIAARTGASNGAAMRVAPAGLIHPGDLEGACRTAAISCFPTHQTQIGMAGACAIAAGVAEGLTEGADVFSVVRACLWGARRGTELGAELARVVPGPSVEKRIEWAVSLALNAHSMEECLAAMEAYIGNSVMIAETVPAAVGFFVFAGGDVLESVAGGVNVGNDTDTIAAISGALAGALKGIDGVPSELYATVRSANPVDMDAIARRLGEIAIANSAARAAK